MFVPFAKDLAKALSTNSVAFHLTDSDATYTLDVSADRQRVQPAANSADNPLVVECPDEEVIRFLSGRHFVPGTQPQLKAVKGTAQDMANLQRASPNCQTPNE